MARPLRIEYPGAWYHVMNRGGRRRFIFNTDDQHYYFLSLLGEVHSRCRAEIHAYCLMGNHYHLLIRTPEANLQRIMRHVNGLYTQYFNRTEGKDGALFRGRYQAILVDADSHWLELSRYIHRNPLAAQIVRRLQDYRWSSYRAYVGLTKPFEWLHTRYILNAIGRRNPQARYKAYMQGDSDDALAAFYKGSKIAPLLGNERFKAKVLASIPQHPDIPERRQAQRRPSLKTITTIMARYYGVPKTQLFTPTRGRGVKTPARSLAMYVCQETGGMTLATIADEFGLSSYASAGATIRNVRQRLEEDRGLRRDLKYILQDLTP
ncbi:MAG: transposase [Gammaproteobacteria bacterium]